MFLIAFGQKKMFTRWIPAIFHFFIYAAFLLTQIEFIEMILDGILGTHRFIGSQLAGTAGYALYSFLINSIEILNALAFIATIVFLSRRNLIKLPRLNMAELKGWPMKDANLILFGEIFLVFGIFLMNGAESTLSLQGHSPFHFFLSSSLSSIFASFDTNTLRTFMSIGWWLHLLGVLGFIIYLPFSKHLHIFLAFPNAYLTSPNPKGYIPYMPEILHEIKSMMGESVEASDPNVIPKFGARDIFDLSQKNLLDAYACTECGRCTSSCPANQTGKKLSPRKIMMDTRDRLEEVGRILEANKNEWKDDGKSLLHSFISVEELRACTTCNACVEECPVNISPLDIILQLRRNLIMEESNSTQEWNAMFGNIENNGAPWKFAQSERGNWAR